MAAESLIVLRRLHRFFGSTRAVEDISFEVRAGEVLGYIGPNGAGKTTSMRILATLELPTYGDALVDGFSVVNDPDRVRQQLGYMPDAFGTYPDVNCREYLDFFARAYGLKGIHRRQAMSRVMEFTALDRLAEKPISGLSKGMKQRLCLARALIHDPRVLILDEPAAGLDPRARIELRNMIRELAEQGKAILISSHILTELAEMCDRVAIIEQGRLVAVGTVAEIQNSVRPRSEVRLRVLGDSSPVLAFLQQHTGITQLQVDGQEFRLEQEGGEEAQAELLRELVLQRFRLVEFSTHEQSLEQVFLQVTRGAVQ